MSNTDGLPRVKQAHPREFYRHVEEHAKELVSWRGELYFELHRGTYTSQSNNKLWNRQSEFLLRDAELLAAIASLGTGGFAYPSAELTRLWKLVCLNQFHDVIPGSSINMVYRDSDKLYKDIRAAANGIRRDAASYVCGQPAVCGAEQAGGLAVINTTGWMRTDVIAVAPTLYRRLWSADGIVQTRASDGAVLVPVSNVPGFGVHRVDPHVGQPRTAAGVATAASGPDGVYVLENNFVRVVVNAKGQIASLVVKDEQRELVPAGAVANFFELYDDVPLYWDAWDIEIYSQEKYTPLDGADVSIADRGPLVASLTVRVPIGSGSVLTQTIALSGHSPRLEFDCDVDWHENRKCLKVSFTWDIHSDVATYETQYGVVQRPTHRNTSWDMAKFEVCAHKFADLSEFGYGVALLNDCKYGHATLGNTMSLTLMRAPKAPDEYCDMGRHRFRYAVYPHSGTFSESNVVQEAYQFNVPLLELPVGCTRLLHDRPFFSLSGARNVVLDTVKVAEDDTQSYIVRMYEAYGGHARAILTTRLPASAVAKVNILEEPMSSGSTGEAAGIHWLERPRSLAVQFKPFEVVSLKFTV
ncbi:Glycoside hydrolase, 38 vacuolar alpha mannosidase [Coemansia spiralis]|nr:Glycoside hydrolase, 38 vacuolar alpha mannosidase [Coemansia spiralis]